MSDVPLIFEKSRKGKEGFVLTAPDVPQVEISQVFDEDLIRCDLDLPEVSEVDVIRHYTKLSTMNFGVDSGFYPLGSCTMKYNPKINEEIALMPEFTQLHPYAPQELCQGTLEVMYHMQNFLAEITGMDYFTLQPAAGAHGELTGMFIIKKYFEHSGQKRTKIIVPDSAHGTNPASASQAGFEVISLKSGSDGLVDPKALREVVDENVAALMLTNPNTLGLFEKNIHEIAEILHEKGALLYYDGANLNAVMGIARPADMGFDVVHLNLHKTFSTPHGGGGPGSGPVGVKAFLKDFLPKPIVAKKDDKYVLDYNIPYSIGKIHGFYGNVGVVLKAYGYIKCLGTSGLKEASEVAVLNANYLLKKIKDMFIVPEGNVCKHEFVVSCKNWKENFGVRALDVAKRLLDYGFHPPTIYFPLIVEEALMIEPTETESKDTLDAFCDALQNIYREAQENPDILKSAPFSMPVKRVDEVKAARDVKVIYKQ
ncbi:MAG TPA: aminomethyl-transferring glycine dehydrogenase subunit GcvPB [Tepidanaerobacter syntrophicus]|uniref:aminomethyl-transferring glycine dehydrogenase subunit GcvPB n=1 Tax=Tepidanaerobacter syntrophicus TaxID=224999 RepID=UPI00176B7AE2|nr:aminomethyl-transferring glycine dehydrogenase subunit GcvPB [Tepidanaerobacter syntrophicus]